MLLCVRVGVVDSIVVDGTSLCDGDDAGARPAHKPASQRGGADTTPLPTTSPHLRGGQRGHVWLPMRPAWGKVIWKAILNETKL